MMNVFLKSELNETSSCSVDGYQCFDVLSFSSMFIYVSGFADLAEKPF